MTTYSISYRRRGGNTWTEHNRQDHCTSCLRRRLVRTNPLYEFRVVTLSEPSRQIYPTENTMPWNCAICATERPTAEEPQEVLDDTAQNVIPVCATCYAAVEPNCICCRVRLRNPAITDEGGRHVCFECTDHHFLCIGCNRQQNTDTRMRLPDGQNACRECFQRDYRNCSNCGQAMRRDQGDGGNECARCLRGRVIHQHSYKPRAKFHGAGPLFMGVELEVECGEKQPEDVAHDLVDNARMAKNFAYAKHDGSIHHGFELVSHPFSWDWLDDGGKERWLRMLKFMRESGCRSYQTETCGMHVHVTRSALTPKQLLRLQRLSHNNPDLIHMLSRRRRSNLDQWANPRDTNLAEQVGLARGDLPHKQRRYSAINVTEQTVEIRIFRGTCDDDGFFGNLEAVKSLVEFSKQEIGLFPRAKHYFSFLREHRAEYPNLIGTILKEGALAK